MIEILAKRAASERRAHVDVGGADHAHVDRNRLVPAQALDLPALQEAQQAGLALHRHVADFVEKQGAAVCRLDPADFTAMRAGECAAFVAEQFREHQLVRNRAAIDGDERSRRAWGAAVDRHRGQFLAGARFPRDEHGRVVQGELANRAIQVPHGIAFADHVVLGGIGSHGGRQRAQLRHAVGVAGRLDDPFGFPGQGDVVEAIVAHHLAQRGVLQLAAPRRGDPADMRQAQAVLHRGGIGGPDASGQVNQPGRAAA